MRFPEAMGRCCPLKLFCDHYCNLFSMIINTAVAAAEEMSIATRLASHWLTVVWLTAYSKHVKAAAHRFRLHRSAMLESIDAVRAGATVEVWSCILSFTASRVKKLDVMIRAGSPVVAPSIVLLLLGTCVAGGGLLHRSSTNRAWF